jgi:uncharacterized protein involved in exopolysaccharide biosynthesis
VEQNEQRRRRQAAATAEFLRGELESVKKELDTQETRARSFALTYTDELPQQLDANLAMLERLQEQLSMNGEQQIRLLERRERLEQEMTLGRALVPAAADATSPAVRLQALRQQLDILRRTFSDEYPDVKRTRAEIAALEAEVARNAAAAGGSAVLDPIAQRRESIRDLEAELSSLRARAEDLNRSIARYDALVGRTPRRQIEMDQLTGGRELTRQRYEALLQQYEEAQLSATLEAGSAMEHFRVLDPAIVPVRPIGPDRPLLAGMGVIGALGLALVAVIVREKLDTRLHSPEDLRGMVPDDTIVAVRHIRTWRARRRALPAAAAATLGAVALAVLVASAAYYTADGNERLVRMTLRGAP